MNKQFLAVAAIIYAMTAIVPSQAAERQLNAAEIEAALAGNTVEGNWKGTPFRQFFTKNGTTTYVAEGSAPSPGKWRADPASNQYCSWWRGTGWDCYDIFSDGPNSIIWVVPSDGYRSPSSVLSGKQL